MLRLTEQASVLKGEIRRLERNQERENSISNMEYLKNVVYKVCFVGFAGHHLFVVNYEFTARCIQKFTRQYYEDNGVKRGSFAFF